MRGMRSVSRFESAIFRVLYGTTMLIVRTSVCSSERRNKNNTSSNSSQFEKQFSLTLLPAGLGGLASHPNAARHITSAFRGYLHPGL